MYKISYNFIARRQYVEHILIQNSVSQSVTHSVCSSLTAESLCCCT